MEKNYTPHPSFIQEPEALAAAEPLLDVDLAWAPEPVIQVDPAPALVNPEEPTPAPDVGFVFLPGTDDTEPQVWAADDDVGTDVLTEYPSWWTEDCETCELQEACLESHDWNESNELAPVLDPTHYSHLRVHLTRKTEPHIIRIARVTVAYRIIGAELLFGMSFCAPEDNFNRTVGREQALQRLEENYVAIPMQKTDARIRVKRFFRYLLHLGVEEGIYLPGLPNSWSTIRTVI